MTYESSEKNATAVFDTEKKHSLDSIDRGNLHSAWSRHVAHSSNRKLHNSDYLYEESSTLPKQTGTSRPLVSRLHTEDSGTTRYCRTEDRTASEELFCSHRFRKRLGLLDLRRELGDET